MNYRFFATGLLCFYFFCVGVVSAQENAGITLIPASIEELADPGSVLSEVLTVTNESEVERQFYIYVRNIQGVEAGGVPIFAEDNTEKTGYEIVDWVTLPSTEITVPAFGKVEIPVTISVPQDATPGSHFGGVFISMEPPRIRQTGAGVGYQVASVISIRISGTVIDTARIRSFSTDKLIYGAKKVSFNVKFENQGNILIRPRGPVTIKSMFGGDPEILIVNDALAGVFPHTVRDLNFEWESEGVGFGRYEALLALGYDGDGGQKTVDATAVFWVFPLKVTLTIIGSIVLIFLLGYIFTRYYINQAIMQAQGGRRIVSSRYRRSVGVSRFVFICMAILALTVLFLLLFLVLSV